MPQSNRTGVPVQVWIDQDLRNALQAVADANDRPLARELRAALVAHVARHQDEVARQPGRKAAKS